MLVYEHFVKLLQSQNDFRDKHAQLPLYTAAQYEDYRKEKNTSFRLFRMKADHIMDTFFPSDDSDNIPIMVFDYENSKLNKLAFFGFNERAVNTKLYF